MAFASGNVDLTAAAASTERDTNLAKWSSLHPTSVGPPKENEGAEREKSWLGFQVDKDRQCSLFSGRQDGKVRGTIFLLNERSRGTEPSMKYPTPYDILCECGGSVVENARH